ncbi:trans-cinnamate 4-monooxygenase [Fagus crenata]
MDNLFSLVLYHSGHFVNNLHGYEGGVKTVFDKIPGISIEDVGLHMVNSHHDAMLITELVLGYGEIEVYVEHIVEEPVKQDTDNSDDDSWDSVEDVEQSEVMGAGVLHFDYESEDLHIVGVGLNESESESESDGNNAEVDDNADVDDSAGVNGR